MALKQSRFDYRAVDIYHTAIALQELTVAPRCVDVELNVTEADFLYAVTFIGRLTNTGFTAPVSIAYLGSFEQTGDQGWAELISRDYTALGASIAEQALNATEPVGETSIALAAGTNFAAGDYTYFDHTTTANSEFHEVVAVSGATITIRHGLANIQAAATTTVRDQAERFTQLIDVRHFNRFELFVDGSLAGQNFAVKVEYQMFKGPY